MITIIFNNKPTRIAVNSTLLALLEATAADKLSTFFAAAVNKHFIPRGQYSKTMLSENDVIDLIVPMQGG